jgi:ATP-dependent Clp protease adaptor protein ClpS
MARQPDTREDGGVAIATRTKPKLKRPPLFKVLLHNDDFTTMEFVVSVLQSVFHHDENGAVAIMLNVHNNGVGVAGVYSYEIAETKVAKVTSLAREAGYPLLCTLEPEN